MKIDVELCGQCLIMWRRETHLRNVIDCVRVTGLTILYVQNFNSTINTALDIYTLKIQRSPSIALPIAPAHSDIVNVQCRRGPILKSFYQHLAFVLSQTLQAQPLLLTPSRIFTLATPLLSHPITSPKTVTCEPPPVNRRSLSAN